jgi:hypothetical protein
VLLVLQVPLCQPLLLLLCRGNHEACAGVELQQHYDQYFGQLLLALLCSVHHLHLHHLAMTLRTLVVAAGQLARWRQLLPGPRFC